ncbi:MAG: hypothetical protein AB7T10_00660 [bacterium]
MKDKNIILIDGNNPHLLSLKFILEKNGYGVAVKTPSELRDSEDEERIIVIDAQATDLDMFRDDN